MSRRMWVAAMVASLMTGCGDANEDWREQPLATVVANRSFRLVMNGFSGNSYGYDIDPRTWTLHGFRISVTYVMGNVVHTRARVDTAHAVAATSIADALARTPFGVIEGRACEALKNDAANIASDGDIPVLTVGGQTYGGLDACERVDLSALVAATEQGFETLNPVRETVKWDGHDYQTVTP